MLIRAAHRWNEAFGPNANVANTSASCSQGQYRHFNWMALLPGHLQLTVPENGNDIKLVQKLMRHAKVTMTMALTCPRCVQNARVKLRKCLERSGFGPDTGDRLFHSHTIHRKHAPARTPAPVSRCSVLARQVDHVVHEVQRDSIQRKIGALDLFGEHDVAVAVIARKRSASVGAYGELPDLKFLGGNSLVVGLNDRDFVQKPIRAAVLGNVLRAIGVENVAVDSVPIPVFAASELREVAFAESLRRHGSASFLEVTPRAEAREATRTAARKARRHRYSVPYWQKVEAGKPITHGTQLAFAVLFVAPMCDVVRDLDGIAKKRAGESDERT